jgi:predicted DCC family thiol-disulfide oxidoreductase YuxK
MKTLNNHVILFDNECPMCYAYTKAFVKTGMLPEDGREAYQQMPENICPLVDRQRAANEIALVNTENGEVTYGIQSLFKIIAHAMPFFKPLFLFGPFIYLMRKFYAFISYNRKVIIPVAVKENTIQPTFKIQYRIAYLLFTWLLTAYVLTAYAHVLTDFVPLGSLYREYFICGGQIFFQGIIIAFYKKEKLWDYLGNMMTISFAGALLLLPGLVLAKYFSIHPLFFILYFLMVAGLMFLEHLRRSKLLQLGWVMSITWAFYRLIVLGLIFSL